jgi:23S rRNA pseudouridine1911/1915/1917 synthase
VHPTYKNPAGTLLDALRSDDLPRPSIVGRLDKWTSGIVVVAKSAMAHAALQGALARPDAIKEYVAIVHGRVAQAAGRIDLPLRVDPADRRRVVVSEDGARSVTVFERVRATDAFSLLSCRLQTGRRHQVRGHFAAIGHPLVGDRTYGEGGGFTRHALHAVRLGLTLPWDGKKVCLTAPIPSDFGLLLTLLS